MIRPRHRHPLSRLARLFALALLASGASAAEEKRDWIRASDGRAITASLVSHDAATGKVTLMMDNQKSVTIDAAILSEADKTFLAERAAKIATAVEAAGFARIEMVEPANGGGHQMHIYKPRGYIDGDPAMKTRPIAFLFSPAGNSLSVLNRLKPAADELGWVLVGVDAYKNAGSLEDQYEEKMKFTKAAFEDAKGRVDFDPSKIVFGGLSAGGWWSYQCAADLTQDAAGILSFGGWIGRNQDKGYSKKMVVANIHGQEDKRAADSAAADGQVLKDRFGAEVKTFGFPGGFGTAPAETVLEAARWIHTTKKF